MQQQRSTDETAAVGLPDLEGMALFVRVAESGSLSAAGRALGLPKATVSRRIAKLERRLGTQLLRRSTRALSLTGAGQALLDRAAPLVADAVAAEREILAASGTPAGLLRVTAPVAFGQAVLLPRLVDFLERHRAVRLDLELTDRRANLVADGFDLAVRMGDMEDTELVARRIGVLQRRLVAAPAYAVRKRLPARPEELRGHDCLVVGPDLRHWAFRRATDGAEVVMPVAWRAAVRDMLALHGATMLGLGIALIPCFLADRELAAGRLLPVLPGWEVAPTPVVALRSSARVPSLALRRLIDELAASPIVVEPAPAAA